MLVLQDNQSVVLEAGLALPADPGALVVDDYEPLLASSVLSNWTMINTSLPQTYVVMYAMNGTDAQGLTADVVYRAVLVQDTTAPVRHALVSLFLSFQLLILS